MRKRGTSGRRPMSIRLSVTFVYCIQTAKYPVYHQTFISKIIKYIFNIDFLNTMVSQAMRFSCGGIFNIILL